MNQLIKKIHIYSGLISFTALLIYGVIGIVATFLPRPDDRPKPEATVREISLSVPEDLDDRQLADHIRSELDLPLTRRAPDWSLGRNKKNNLRFRLPTPGHYHDVVVMEQENRIRITTQPYDLWQYLFHLHEMTPQPSQDDLRKRLWAYYGLFNVWALIMMSCSGVYLWLSTKRRKYWWAQISFSVGTLTFVALYLALR